MHALFAAVVTSTAILRRSVCAVLLPLVLVAATSPADAQYARLGFGQFKHTRWTADDGAPVGIAQILQTPDGYLWLTADALYRFDGVTFERIDPPAGSTMERASPVAMMVSRAGELWVGYRDGGGIAVYRQGRLHDMHMPRPPRAIGRLAETADGAIWATVTGTGMPNDRLRRFAGGRWETADSRMRLPPGAPMGLVVGPKGDLWVPLSKDDGKNGSLARLPPGGAQFLDLPYRLLARPRVALDPTGAVWASDANGTRLLLEPDGSPSTHAIMFPPVPKLRAATLVFDREGGIWGTTESSGIFYISAARKPGRTAQDSMMQFGAVDGLTSDVSYVPFVDREGSVWIGTEQGLDQFRPAAGLQEKAIPPDPTGGLLIAGAPSGDVYVVSRGSLFLIAAGRAPRAILDVGRENASLCSARDGGVWFVDPKRAYHIQTASRVQVPIYPGGAIPIFCAEDRHGRLWVALLGGKWMWRDPKGWHEARGAIEKTRPWGMVTAPSGNIAFTTPLDLAIVEENQFKLVKLARFGLGTPSMVAAGARDIFLSGSGGLLRVRGDRFARLDEKRFPWLSGLRSLVQTERGETWLFKRTAISRVATADLDRAFDSPQAPLARTSFNSHDGLSSTMQHAGFPGIQAVAGADGRVWFLNREGAAFFDPAALLRNSLPPPVAVRSLVGAGQVYRDPANLTLPPGTRALDITYAGLSLSVPDRVQFRYRLEGADDDWVNPGSRRLASYANLGPGHYRFQVIASNNDGVWNKTGATLDFEIRPTFLQSWPFKLLCAVIVVALLSLAYSLRLRSVANRIRARMAERIAERERIARDLHDTLLQSVQALTLRFQLVVDELPVGERARPALEAAIDRADQVIAEGRDRVKELRLPQEGNDIEQIISDLVARQGFAPAVAVIETVGTQRALDALAVDEIARIAGEAIFNIRRHARATRVAIEIRHHASFAISFVDNGVGIDPEIVDHGGRDGHFGLPGMRERARKLDGDLIVRRIAEGGTQVMLTVPGRIAYKAQKFRLFPRWWKS
jgi:signal transduction histidine kinase/streptogramin lyase